MIFNTRIRAYDPNGASKGLLVDALDYTFSQVVNDFPALKVTYPIIGNKLSWLQGPIELGVEIADASGNWVEKPNCRYIYQNWSQDESKGPGDTLQINLPGIGITMSYAKVLFQGAIPSLTEDKFDSDGKRKFRSQTIGAILSQILTEARAFDSGIANAISLGFDSAVDSAGATWNKIVSIAYDPGTSFADIVKNFADDGLIDWWFDGRVLKMYNADTTLGPTDLTVVLDKGRGSGNQEAPVNGTIEGLKHKAILRGDGKTWIKDNPGAPAPWGKNLVFINQGGVTDSGTADLMIQGELEAGSMERISYTRKYLPIDMKKQPMVDFQAGTYVKVRNRKDTYETMRVLQISIDVKKNNEWGATFVLNDKFESLLARQARRMRGIVRGAVSDAGNGGNPTPSPTNPPAKVTNVQLTTLGYWLGHLPKSSIQVTWSPVTTDIDGTSLGSLAVGYEVQYRPNVSSEAWRALGMTETTSIAFDDLQVQTDHMVRVRAYIADIGPGAWSDIANITTAYPTQNLDAPTPLILSSANGNVEIVWDGNLNSGTAVPAPPNFRQLDVYMSTTQVGGYSMIGSVLRGSDRLLMSAPGFIGTDLWFYAIAVDVLGRQSDPGVAQKVTVVGIDGANLIVNSVTGNKITAGSIETRHLSASVGQELDLSSNAGVNIIVTRLQGVEDETGQLTGQVQEIGMRYRFGPNGLSMSEPGSNYQLLIKNDEIDILESGAVVSYWNSGTLFVKRFVGDEVLLGNHMFQRHTTGTVMRAVT